LLVASGGEEPKDHCLGFEGLTREALKGALAFHSISCAILETRRSARLWGKHVIVEALSEDPPPE
jgi:hypothetical protein